MFSTAIPIFNQVKIFNVCIQAFKQSTNLTINKITFSCCAIILFLFKRVFFTLAVQDKIDKKFLILATPGCCTVQMVTMMMLPVLNVPDRNHKTSNYLCIHWTGWRKIPRLD